MKTMFKRTLALTFALALFCSITANAAMPESEIMPLYNYIGDTTCSIVINGTEASMEASVEADADRCQIKMTLQMRNGSSWEDVESWTSSSFGNSHDVEETYDIDPDESYRLKVTFKVWNGSSTETVTKTDLP